MTEYATVLDTYPQSNPYATPGPAEEPFTTWHEFFRSLRKDSAEEVEEVDPTPVLLEPPYDINPDKAPNPVKAVIKLALANGWRVFAVQRSVVLYPGVAFKTGDRAGQMRPDKTVLHTWVDIISSANSQHIRLWCEDEDGKVNSARTLREYTIRGGERRVRLSDASMRSVIKGE